MDNKEILSVAIDCVRGVETKFAAAQTSEELRKAFIDLNGGSTKISPKNFYRGTALFEVIEELIPVIIDEGIKAETNPLFKLVEYRNIADGDCAEFDLEENANFIVSSAAAGIEGVRRQRIVGGKTINIDTEMKVVRVYENLGRLLAGRIDFNKFVDTVAKAFVDYISQAAYDALAGITASTYGLDSTYVKSGSMTEANMLTLIQHVEAATGKPAMLLGTLTALRKLGSSVTYSAEVNSDLYNQGFVGKFNGVPCLEIKQAHKPGSSTFAIADDALWVVAGDSAIIKVVNEGVGMLINRDADRNADLTQEYVYGQNIGVGTVVNEKIGYWYSIA